MTWLLRFLFGLPARPQDKAAALGDLPELADEQVASSRAVLLPGWFVAPHGDELRVHSLSVEAVRVWLRGVDDEKPPVPIRSSDECDHPECPKSGRRPVDDLRAREDGEGEREFWARFTLIGGGKRAKPPLDSFLNLVRRTHRDADEISEVTITDPYLLVPEGDDGEHGGYDHLLRYLEALGIPPDATFALRVNPRRPKVLASEPFAEARRIFKRTINERFPNCDVRDFSSDDKFHDRFYLARHGGELRGVFGPSMNGLGARSIVLMGALEKSVIDRLDAALG